MTLKTERQLTEVNILIELKAALLHEELLRRLFFLWSKIMLVQQMGHFLD
ncbi:hypothetical protein ACQKNS_22550 [Peribacillus sp. NPDC094092]